jgi:tetratricopeptide (TPR) repeat protein
VARAASDLGLFLRNRGDKTAAADYLRRALEIDEKALGPDDPVTGEDLENLASVAKPEEAAALYARAARHKDGKIAARNLARLAAMAEARGNREESLALYRQALAKEEAASGPRHPRVAAHLNAVALLLEPAPAEPLLRRALLIQEKSAGARHPETAVTLNNLANVLLATGRAAAAEPLARRALSILDESLGPANPRVATSASNLADVLRARRQYAAARKLYERALAIDEKAYGAGHPEVAADRENLAGLLEEMGLREEAKRVRGR